MCRKAKAEGLLSVTLALAILMLVGSVAAADGINTSYPDLPPQDSNSPANDFYAASGSFAAYAGYGNSYVLSDVRLQPDFVGGTVSRSPSGANEIEFFNSRLTGMISVNGGSAQAITLIGPESTVAADKIGNVTGAFQTEMLSLNLAGSNSYGWFILRESPTLASTGKTWITAIDGGQYHIDSFFDVFTELSLDGGMTWIPSGGSAHVVLNPVPEPSTLALLGIGAVGLLGCLWRRKA